MKDQATQKLTKKEARLQVQQALSSLSALQDTLGKKKFQRRLKKVERLLSNGLPKTPKLKKLQAEPVAA